MSPTLPATLRTHRGRRSCGSSRSSSRAARRPGSTTSDCTAAISPTIVRSGDVLGAHPRGALGAVLPASGRGRGAPSTWPGRRLHAAATAAAEVASSRSGDFEPTSVHPRMMPMHKISDEQRQDEELPRRMLAARAVRSWCTAPLECGASNPGSPNRDSGRRYLGLVVHSLILLAHPPDPANRGPTAGRGAS